MRVKTQALLAMLAALMLAVGGSIVARDKATETKPGEHTKAYMDCAKACDDCARTCEMCASHCAHMVRDGKKTHFKTLGTCADCATMCRAAGASAARHGPYAGIMCVACADVCKKCGETCAAMKGDDMMKKCEEECFRCEKACRMMLKHVDTRDAGK